MTPMDNDKLAEVPMPRIGTIERVIADLRKGPWTADACELFANELVPIAELLQVAEEALAAQPKPEVPADRAALIRKLIHAFESAAITYAEQKSRAAMLRLEEARVALREAAAPTPAAGTWNPDASKHLKPHLRIAGVLSAPAPSDTPALAGGVTASTAGEDGIKLTEVERVLLSRVRLFDNTIDREALADQLRNGHQMLTRAEARILAGMLADKFAATPTPSPASKPCRSPYCECDAGECTHPGFHDARHEPYAAAPEAPGTQDGPHYGIIDPDYARVFTMARCLAWAEGYALMMHGSFTRDLDLLAVPWTDAACAPEHLVARIADASGLKPTGHPPGQKPHGRLAWTLVFPAFGDPRFVDLSVTPRLRPVGPEAPAQPVQGEPVVKYPQQRIPFEVKNAFYNEHPYGMWSDWEGLLRTIDTFAPLAPYLAAPPARKRVTGADIGRIAAEFWTTTPQKFARAILAHVGVELEGGGA